MRSYLSRFVKPAASAIDRRPSASAIGRRLARRFLAAYESYEKLIADSGTSHLGVGMLAAVLGMLGNFAVSRYKARVARRIHSMTMAADAKHSWLDVMSSLGALIGLIGVAFGHRWADPIAGFVVTLFILHIGYEVTGNVVNHLMDGVDPQHVEAAEQALRSVPGLGAATVRGRWMGRSRWSKSRRSCQAAPRSSRRASSVGRPRRRCVRPSERCGSSDGSRARGPLPARPIGGTVRRRQPASRSIRPARGRPRRHISRASRQIRSMLEKALRAGPVMARVSTEPRRGQLALWRAAGSRATC